MCVRVCVCVCVSDRVATRVVYSRLRDSASQPVVTGDRRQQQQQQQQQCDECGASAGLRQPLDCAQRRIHTT